MEEKSLKTILVVEDEPDVVSYLVTFFTTNGYNVVSATDGKKGYEKAKANHPDLITLDILMPEESGVRMYRNLHDDPTTNEIPVIMITGYRSDFKKFIETRKQVSPPAGYFEKPIDRDAVLEKVKELIG
ncbi:MAG: response regulator [Calditrichaeota bacterium]|jgi:CheY-like chemotaxis protein|nr:response regulator [Calditrichota bacterium]MBT7618757.1 response regulator [Calditrichota bacterium]MBT7787619.1 response regulator [Calditrichota bacterium]